MSTVWSGNISLPSGSSSSVLEGIELSYEGTAINGYVAKRSTGSENHVLRHAAKLHVVCSIDPSLVPLWMTCGSSLRLRCENEISANILAHLFESKATRTDTPHVDGLQKGTQSAQALLVSVEDPDYKAEEDFRVNMASDLVIYGIWIADQAQTMSKSAAGSQASESFDYITRVSNHQNRVTLTSSLLVFALPLQASCNNQMALSLKADPNIEEARFLSSNYDDTRVLTQSARKRRTDQVLDDVVQAKKNKRFRGLPQGLQLHLSELNGEVVNTASKLPSSVKIKTCVDLTGNNLNNIKPHNASFNDARDVEDQVDAFQRQMSLKLEETTGSVLATQSWLNREPATVTSKSVPSIFERSRREKLYTHDANTLSFIQPISNIFCEKNKPLLQKLVMNSLKMSGLQKKTNLAASNTKGFDEDDEYKLVYHQIMKSTIFALRKSWDSEYVEPERMRTLVDTLTTIYLSGTGIGFDEINNNK